MQKDQVSIPTVHLRHVKADGVNMFYREAGPINGNVVLLLHGFPASSFQFRELILRLGDQYRVIAPDLPGFGFTEVPKDRNYDYTFDALAETIDQFTQALKLSRYALYIFDFGAPTGLRLAMAHPERVTAIVSQNGNAYEDGFGAPWETLRKFWRDESAENREIVRNALGADGIRFQYLHGVSDPSLVAPEAYTLDIALIERAGNMDIQIALHLDYRNNIPAYPEFHKYFRKHQPPLLAIWGKNDVFFIPPGAEAFKRDLPRAEVEFVNSGHFALETHVDDIAASMRSFFAKNGI
jgi:pimeloyl-ACP methyl ester carboxylesterase